MLPLHPRYMTPLEYSQGGGGECSSVVLNWVIIRYMQCFLAQQLIIVRAPPLCLNTLLPWQGNTHMINPTVFRCVYHLFL